MADGWGIETNSDLSAPADLNDYDICTDADLSLLGGALDGKDYANSLDDLELLEVDGVKKLSLEDEENSDKKVSPRNPSDETPNEGSGNGATGVIADSFVGAGDDSEHSIWNTEHFASDNVDINKTVRDELCKRDDDGDTLLHISIIGLCSSLAMGLIPLAVIANSLDLRNHQYQTPLHLAVLTNQKEIADALITHGASVRLQDCRLRTAMHIATEQGNHELLEILLQSTRQTPDDINLSNTDGETCLHIACRAGDSHMVTTLLSSGADVNQGNRKSLRTPLHISAESGNQDMVTLLLGQANIEIDSKTLNSETPLILAKCRGHEAIVNLLRENGAEYNIKKLMKYTTVR